MKKLKVYLVDDGVYWCDYSLNSSFENYLYFCLSESGFQVMPSNEFPRKATKQELSRKVRGDGEENVTLKEMSLKNDSIGLLYCSID